MASKAIKRMLFGIGVILYSYSTDINELLATIGLIIVLSGAFEERFDKLYTFMKHAYSAENEK